MAKNELFCVRFLSGAYLKTLHPACPPLPLRWTTVPTARRATCWDRDQARRLVKALRQAGQAVEIVVAAR